MKFDKIVGFGDSWMYGDELLDPELMKSDPDAHTCWVQNTEYREQHCFLGLLGKHYDLPIENFGIPGGSLDSTQWTYQWWMRNEPNPKSCLVVVFLTESNRFSLYNPNHVHYSNDPPWNKFVHSTWVHFGSSVIGPEFTDLIKRHIVLTECQDLDALRYHQALLFFDGQQARVGMPMIMINTMPAPRHSPSVQTLHWPDFCWTLHFRDHPGNQKRELIMPGGHPNEKGHELIRDLLIPEIDRVTMSR
jgi:hypothetical protein